MASIRPYRTPKSGERRYEVRWREHGVARSKTLTTAADAKAFANETERRLRMGVLHAAKAETFGVLEQAFFDRFKAGLEGGRRPRDKTLESLETTRSHLKPLAKVPVDRVDLQRVEKVVLPIAAKNPRTAELTIRLIKRVLRSAARRGQPIVPSALEASVARAVPRDAVFLTWDQAQQVESFMPEFIRRIVPLAVLTLCRESEMLAIRDRDLNLDVGALTISGQVQKGKRVATKTAGGRRTVDLSPLMVDLFTEQQEARPVNGHGLLFPSPTGQVFTTSNFYGRYFKPACRHAGHPDLTFHGLRHTGASLMIAAGLDPKTIAERMGHVDGGALVLRTYGHLYKGRGREAAMRLEQLVTAETEEAAA